MKKKMILASFALVVATACSTTFLGCGDVRQLDAPQFLDQAKQINEMHTIKNTELIGVAGDRVYLEYWSKSFFYGSNYTIYWTQLSKLPEELASDLKAGKNPWKSER